MSDAVGFGWGCFGGILAEIWRWHRLRYEGTGAPEWIKSAWYWFCFTAMSLAGGGLVVVYLESNAHLNPVLAVVTGAAAPAFISRALGDGVQSAPGKVD